MKPATQNPYAIPVHDIFFSEARLKGS